MHTIFHVSVEALQLTYDLPSIHGQLPQTFILDPANAAASRLNLQNLRLENCNVHTAIRYPRNSLMAGIPCRAAIRLTRRRPLTTGCAL